MSPRLAFMLAALLASAAGGWHLGAGQVQARWTEADLQRERAATTLHAQQIRHQAEQADAFEAERQRLRLTLTEARHDQTTALQSPVDCTGPALRLADVPVPAAALDGLRRAGASLSAPD